MKMFLSLDCETTGVDFFHGASPFFVTICREDGDQEWWEWDVDPLTREVQVPPGDVRAIVEATCAGQRMGKKEIGPWIVGQNIKFDVHALRTIGISEWNWSRTYDTLLAGHLLASNHPHDLTSMAMEYLSVDIQPLEDHLEKAVKEARKIAKREFPDWAIAQKGRADMPSAKEKTWKYDSWLPKAVYDIDVKEDIGLQSATEGWDTVLADYANADSAVTLQLWKAMRAEIERRGLWEMYLERLKNLPVLFEMEDRGVSLIPEELWSIKEEYQRESIELTERCVGLAMMRGRELVLPKGSANNKSLTSFAFDGLGLPIIKRTETGQPSLDREVMDVWGLTVKNPDQQAFVKSLKGLRKRNKSLEFFESYEKYMIDNVLHPSLNPTGTDTTRLSCGMPNLQQVSKQESQCAECGGEGCDSCGGTGEDLHSVRRVFGPAPGREWWTMDAENIELRIPAFESGEQDLIRLFNRPKDPPFYGSQHLLNFSVVYEDVWLEELRAVGLDKVGPHCKKKYASTYYQFTKNGDFSIQYQCGEATAAKSFRRKGAFIKLKTKFNKLAALNHKYVDFANRHGYVETLPDKTVDPKHGYPLLCKRGGWGNNIVPTTPLSYHVQGTAGWWTVKAMNRCHAKLREWKENTGFDGFMCLPVHDELMFDFPKNKNGSNSWRARVLQKLMEQGGDDIGVPTPVTVEYHANNWAEGEKI